MDKNTSDLMDAMGFTADLTDILGFITDLSDVTGFTTGLTDLIIGLSGRLRPHHRLPKKSMGTVRQLRILILMDSVEMSRQCEFDSYFSCAGGAEKSNIVA